MAVITDNINYFLKITVRGRTGSGGKNGGLQIANQNGVDRWTQGIEGTADTMDVRNFWASWQYDYIIDGTPSVPLTRQQQYDYLVAVLGLDPVSTTKTGMFFFASFSSGNYHSRAVFSDFKSLILGMADSTDGTILVQWTAEATSGAPDEPAGDPPTFCDNGLYWIYDDVADTMSIDLYGTEYVMFTGVTSDALVKTNFETIYSKGEYDYAWNVTTGEICVIYKGTGSGTFTYSVELSDTINLGDTAEAFVVSRWPVDRRKWV